MFLKLYAVAQVQEARSVLALKVAHPWVIHKLSPLLIVHVNILHIYSYFFLWRQYTVYGK